MPQIQASPDQSANAGNYDSLKMALTYRYKGVKRPGGIIKTPSIPVTLKGTNETIAVVALLDSGADLSAIPRDLAELLGLDLSGKKDFVKGIGGEVESVETKIWLTLGKDREKYNFLIPIKVLLTNDDFGIIIGRAGFFDKFLIIFDESNEKVILKRRQKR